MEGTTAADQRKRADRAGPATSGATRRRGGALEAAIFEAAIAQIGEVGYERLTMERIAAAAHTGKAAIYRRWPSKEDLVRDAFVHALPTPADVPVHDNVRDDLLALLTAYWKLIEVSRESTFQVLKAEPSTGSLLRDTVRERILDPLKELLHRALLRGAERGQVRPDAALEHIVLVGPALINSHCLHESFELSEDYLRSVVDEILMPLITPPEATGPQRPDSEETADVPDRPATGSPPNSVPPRPSAT